MKPIEKGCLALIIKSNAGNEGITVIVGNFIGAIDGWGGVDNWEIDKSLPSMLGNAVPMHYRGSWMIRIDNYQPYQEIEQKKEETA